jgi:hypothetical protein
MTHDFEERLRQSLQTRAQDVTPDPALYREVQSRIRRGRILRWSFAGAGALAVVALAALVVPSVLDRRIEFEPGPVATQPPAEDHSMQTGPVCAGEDEALVAVVARTDGDLHALCASGAEEPLTATQGEGTEDAPALSPDGTLLAYQSTFGHSARVEVFDLVANEPVETIDNASSPAFGSNGNLAFIRDEEGEQPQLVVREGEHETVSSMIPDIPEEFTARHLVWGESPTPRLLYWEAQYEGTTVWGDDYIEDEPWRYDVVGDGNYAAPSSREEERLHLLRTCCVQVEGDRPETVELGVLTLPDTQAPFEPLVELPPDFDASGTLSLGAAATADIDETTGAWRAGSADAWLVGDGDRLYLVDEDGNTDLVSTGVFSVAFNRAVTLPPSPDAAPSPGALAQVDVFFGSEGSECGESTTAHQRQVEGPGVLRGALEELLAGPSAGETAAGARSVFSDATAGALNDVTIDPGGVARVDFADFSDHVPNSSCATMAMLAQLDATVQQFPTVKEVVYSFDGDVDTFYAAYELSTPPHRPDIPLAVTRMQERISDAVVRARQDGDYDPLAELIDRETFSCSFSDQNEDCIALWQQQEAEGQDPLGPLAEILRGDPVKNPDAPIWVWPGAWLTDEEYLGPRTGIQRNGTWRYYQQGGD